MCFTKLLYNHTHFNVSHISYKNKKIKVYMADSAKKQMIGLMYRDKLYDNEAMLFLPMRYARHSIWMLNMRFSIDIFWLSKSGEVVDMYENAKPCKSVFGCKSYLPKYSSFYVLEMNSGSARRLGLKLGSQISIGSINKSLDL
jgi:uncharacterized membrane protein (UPF0127 family)